MARQRVDRDRIARVLADADLLGDRQAAAKHKVAERTVRYYRMLAGKEPELAEKLSDKRSQLRDEADKHWRSDAVLTLRVGLERARELIPQLGPEQVRDLAGLLKIIGDLDIARSALVPDEQHPPDDRQGPGARPRPRPRPDVTGSPLAVQ